MPEIRSAFNANLAASGTITLSLRTGESRARVTLSVVDKLAALVLFGTTFIDRFIRSINPTERKIAPHHCPPVSILIVHEARSAIEKKEDLRIRQEVEEDLELFVTPTCCDPKNITVAQRVELEAVCETPVLVSTKAAGLIKVFSHEKIAKHNAYTTAKGITDAYPDRPFYVTIANFSKFDVNLPKRREVGEVANAPIEIVHVNDIRYSYSPCTQANNCDSTVNYMH